MVRINVIVTVLSLVAMRLAVPDDLFAQRLYSGSSTEESQYPGGGAVDAYGRAVNAEGRPIDRFGLPNNGSNRRTTVYAYPNHAASSLYYPGGYSGLSYSNGLGYSVGVGGYSGGYLMGAGAFSGVGGTTYLAPPRTIGVTGVYPSRVIMNNSTRGGSVEYTNNGNGYIYSPGSSYQSVVSSGPNIFPSTTVVSPSQPPILIQSQPLKSTLKATPGATAAQPASVIPGTRPGDIQLVNPKESTATLSYALNGTSYTIKPGYSQAFPDDRVWTIEFLRGGSGSLPVKYDLRAGTYLFTIDENGWDLKRFTPAPIPELLTTPTPVATPVPSPPPSPSL